MRPGNGKVGQAVLAFLFLALMAGAATLLLVAPQQANAAGGSKTVNQAAYVAVTGASSLGSAATPNVIQNDYILVPVGFIGTGQHVSGVSDTGSTTFTKVVSSSTNEDVELWCGQYTAASGTDTVTVTASASASFGFRVIFVAGLSSCTAATRETNSGTSGSPSVASFTPATGNFCEIVASDANGASPTWTDSTPFAYDGSNGADTPFYAAISGNNFVLDAYRGAWNSNDGATTGTLTASSSTSPAWDEVIACLPTPSAGNELYDGPLRGGPRTSTNVPGEGVNSILKGDYLVQLTVIQGTGITVSSVADSIGAGDTYTKVASSDTYNDVELWIGQAKASFLGPGITDTLSGSAANSIVQAWNIGSISSTTAEVFTSSGAGSTVSLGAGTVTPNTDDMCIEVAAIYTNSGSTTFTNTANSPLQNLGGVQTAAGDVYLQTAVRADWPAGVSTTGTISETGVGSGPEYDVVMVCFPGTVTVPLTCTMDNSGAQATVALSESSGNSLSPTSALCNGVSQGITVDPSVTLTATEPVDAANTRDRFSGGGTTTADAVCATSASGSCAAWSFTNYEQFQNTYQATPHLKNWDNSLTIPVTGTVAGTAGSAVCTISPSGGTSTTVSCSGWTDYDRAVTFPTTATGAPANTRWFWQGSPPLPLSGGNTYTANYYDQLQNTYRATPNAQTTWDNGLTPVTAVGSLLGSTGQTICSITLLNGGGAQSCTGFADYNAAVVIGTATIGGAPANTQWLRSGACSFTQTTSGNTDNCNFYKQLLNTYEAVPTVPTTWDTGYLLDGNAATSGGTPVSPVTLTISTTQANDLVVIVMSGNTGSSLTGISDTAGLTWYQRFSAPNDGRTLIVEYAIAPTALSSDTVSITWSGGTGNIRLQEFAVTGVNTAVPFDPNVALPGVTSGSTSPTGTIGCGETTTNANDFLFSFSAGGGTPVPPPGFTEVNSVLTFPGVLAYEVVPSVQSGVTETWTGESDSAGFSVAYCDAIQLTGSGVTVTGTSLGSAGQTVCMTNAPIVGTSTPDACSGYADYDTPVTMGILTVSATERWVPATSTYTDTSGGNTHPDAYTDQFQVSFAVSPAGTGTVSPSGSNVWENYGALSITGTPNSGYAFSIWTAVGSITFGSPSSSSTTASIAGAGTITAGFSPTVAFASVSDSYVFSDAVSSKGVYTRGTADSFSFSDLVSRSDQLFRSLTDSYQYIDGLETQVQNLEHLVISVADSFVTSDAASRTTILARLVSDAVTFASVAQRQLDLFRSAVDGFLVQSVQSVQSRLLSLFASVTDTVKTAVSAIGSITSSVSSLSTSIASSISSTISSTISSITASLSSSLTSSSSSSTSSGGQRTGATIVVLLGLLLVVLIGLPIFFVFGRRRKKKKESETR
jgi:hypothetical protein